MIEQTLRPPNHERATVIGCMLSSLDQPDERIDALWAKDAEDRIAAVEAGEMQAIPAEEVFVELGDEHHG